MKKAIIPAIILIIALGIVWLAYAQEQLTLTTYYPAPFGAYDQMRLVPQDASVTTPVCNASTEGSMLYNTSAGWQAGAGLYVCDGGTWTQVGVASAGGSSEWTRDNSVSPEIIYPNNLTDRVGIGTSTPQYSFHVKDPAIGLYQMFFNDTKGAFRAGVDFGTGNWSDANTGMSSIAFGSNPIASADHSIAMGSSAEATANHAVAIGYGAKAYGTNSFSIGKNAVANGNYSYAMGPQLVRANGNNSFAMGFNVDAQADRSMVIGTGQSAIPLTALANNISDSLVIGFSSGNPTFFVEDGAVGIETTTPDFTLSIGDPAAANPDGGIIAAGTYNAGDVLPDLGAGTRMVWYPRKAAFRAGRALGTEWDDAQIGNFSFATGSETQAGDYSAAFGIISKATGSFSMAGGQMSEAAGNYSFAYGNLAKTGPGGSYSMAVGNGAEATANSSYAIGYQAKANGIHSTALGYKSVANASYSFVWGTNGCTATTSGFKVCANNVTLDIPVLIAAPNHPLVQSDIDNRIGQASSSKIYKENIVDLEIDSSAIYNLRPVSFTWKGTDYRDYGLIAEEVDQVFPDLVSYDEENKPQSVQYDKLPVLLVAEIQKLQARVDELEEKLKKLQ